MEHLAMQTTNQVDENIRRIGELFPNCLTERLNDEGKPEVAIDFDQLRQELSKEIVEGPDERYQFTWPDKRNAIRLANAPTTDTLRPCRNESVDFDNTQNLYIEGDNLQVLKLLRENYLGKVKMIYIDPPYNTGNDFVYNDDFAQEAGEYIHNSGQYDQEGNRLVANTESNGRFHTDWLNMIYPRLKVAKDLLSEDGVIFISLDETETYNLKKLCDEIFGTTNYVTNFHWKKKGTTSNVKGAEVSSVMDTTLCYRKTINAIITPRIRSKETRNYPEKDSEGNYRLTIIEKKDSGSYKRDTMKFPILGHFPREGKRWQIGIEKAKEYEKKNRFIFDGEKIQLKIYEFEDNDTTSAWPNLFDDCGSSDSAAQLVNVELFQHPELFDNPKPVELIVRFLNISSTYDSIILDFFSGSATTAHAVMQLNAEDGGKRKFIMVQLPEETDEKSEARKAGYKNICEIGKERIRRAGKKIKEEHPEAKDLDIGFRVLKLDSSNMKDVFYTPSKVTQMNLFDSAENIKEDRLENDGEDLLFQVMIELGISLSAKIKKETIANKAVWNVNDGYLLACFAKDLDESVITDIAKQKPYYFVMRDAGLANDNVADNFDQLFKYYSPETIRRIL